MPETAPVTKLEAVNRMLHDLGDRPVNSLADPTRLDVVRAINSIDQTSKMLQIQGWWFNTEKIRITVDGSGFYNIPVDITHVKQLQGGPRSGTEGTPALIVRGSKLYDVTNATNVFAGGASILLKVHRLLVFEDLPASVREYVYASGAIRFQSRALGSGNVDSDLKLQAEAAFAIIHEEQISAEALDTTFSPSFRTLMHDS